MLPAWKTKGIILSTYIHVLTILMCSYIVQTGIYGITCFLPFASVPNALGTLAVGMSRVLYIGGTSSKIFLILLGQPIETLVESVNFGANTVTLRAQRKSVAEAMTRSSKLAFSSLQPGMMVNAVVDKVATVIIVIDKFFYVCVILMLRMD